ncbi:MAG: endonuclease/exonuclease/phosphatase family protein [Thermoanaerobaculia bacterium]
MQSEPRRSVRRLLAIAALLFALFAIYRVFGVYTVRSGECGIVEPYDGVVEVRDTRGRFARFPPRPGEARNARELVVMSFNIEGHAALLNDAHLPEVAAVIRQHNPDVVGLQEVHRGTWQSRFDDQIAELARLTGLKFAYGRSVSPVRGEYGNAVLTRGTIVESDVIALPSLGEPRSLLRSTIDLDGARLNFYVTHLTAWGSVRRENREEQCSCVAEHLRGSRIAFIIVGDFNASLDDPEMKPIGSGDNVRYAGNPTEESHPLTGDRLDHIFTDSGFTVVTAKVLREGPSDHWPLIARLRWTRNDVAPAPPAGEDQ